MALSLSENIRLLYMGRSIAAQRFRYGLLAFDIITLAFLVVSSFVRVPNAEVIDACIGILLAVDFAARMVSTNHPWRYLATPYGVADVLVMVSLIAPLLFEGLAFLRLVRLLRVLRCYQLIARLRLDFPFIAHNEQAILAALNLFVFIFGATALVYETQHLSNAGITSYLDALYFTVTTLTTTGFGDITLQGSSGRILSVVIMIFGISMFLRLVQVVLRPTKVIFKCSSCGLKRHDFDAVHCKACGQILNIEDDGAT